MLETRWLLKPQAVAVGRRCVQAAGDASCSLAAFRIRQSISFVKCMITLKRVSRTLLELTHSEQCQRERARRVAWELLCARCHPAD